MKICQCFEELATAGAISDSFQLFAWMACLLTSSLAVLWEDTYPASRFPPPGPSSAAADSNSLTTDPLPLSRRYRSLFHVLSATSPSTNKPLDDSNSVTWQRINTALKIDARGEPRYLSSCQPGHAWVVEVRQRLLMRG